MSGRVSDIYWNFSSLIFIAVAIVDWRSMPLAHVRFNCMALSGYATG